MVDDWRVVDNRRRMDERRMMYISRRGVHNWRMMNERSRPMVYDDWTWMVYEHWMSTAEVNVNATFRLHRTLTVRRGFLVFAVIRFDIGSDRLANNQ